MTVIPALTPHTVVPFTHGTFVLVVSLVGVAQRDGVLRVPPERLQEVPAAAGRNACGQRLIVVRNARESDLNELVIRFLIAKLGMQRNLISTSLLLGS